MALALQGKKRFQQEFYCHIQEINFIFPAFLPCCSGILVAQLKWLFSHLCFSLCCCWTLSPLELQSEHALTVNHSDLDSTHPDAPLTLARIYYLGKRLKESKSAPESVHLAFIFYFVCFCFLSSLYSYWSRPCFILKLSSPTTAFSPCKSGS